LISVCDEGSIHQGIAPTTVGRLLSFHNKCLKSENKNNGKVSQNTLISATLEIKKARLRISHSSLRILKK
jgi:hypothetical protein